MACKITKALAFLGIFRGYGNFGITTNKDVVRRLWRDTKVKFVL